MMNKKPDRKIMEGFSERFILLADKHDKGLSNKALGKMFAVSDTTIFKWKNAESMPKIANAVLIAERYKVSVDYVLTGRDGRDDVFITAFDALSPSSQERILENIRAYRALEQQENE